MAWVGCAVTLLHDTWMWAQAKKQGSENTVDECNRSTSVTCAQVEKSQKLERTSRRRLAKPAAALQIARRPICTFSTTFHGIGGLQIHSWICNILWKDLWWSPWPWCWAQGGPILGKIAAELLQFPVAHHHARKTCGNLATDGMFVHKLDRWKQVTSHPLAGNCCFNARTLIVLTVLDSTSKWTCRGCFRLLGSAVSSPLFHPHSHWNGLHSFVVCFPAKC